MLSCCIVWGQALEAMGKMHLTSLLVSSFILTVSGGTMGTDIAFDKEIGIEIHFSP